MKNKFRIALLSMAAIGLVGCADKLSDDITQQEQGGTADGFVAFQINSVVTGTRAAGDEREGAEDSEENKRYETGTTKEYAITSDQGANVVFFFDKNGSYIDKSYLELMSSTTTSSDHTAEMVFSARVKRQSDDNSDYYCVVILNANPKALEEITTKATTDGETDLNVFMTQTDNTYIGKYGSGDEIYLTMSNTIYVDEDKTDSDGKKELHGPQLVESSKICKTWEEANTAENKVIVHVERIVAKFGMTFNDSNEKSIFSENYSDIIEHEKGLFVWDTESNSSKEIESWGIRIKGWNVNATETETYWVKNLALSGNSNITTWNPIAKLNTGKEKFGNWGLTYNYSTSSGWNDKSRVRSYWAVDPHYDSASDKYPIQYRKADDDENMDYLQDMNNKNVLNYIKWEDIVAGIDAGKSVTEISRYAPENTFGDYSEKDGFEWFKKAGTGSEYLFAGDGYRWTGTHILVAAELLFGDEVSSTATSTPKDKYCFEGVYWIEDQVHSTSTGTAQTKDYGKLITQMVSSLTKYYPNLLYTDENATSEFTTSQATEYFELTKATIKGGDGRLMLKIKNGKSLYNKNKQKVNDALKSYIQEAGTVQHFSGGKMYYAIPIEHMVQIQKDADKKTTAFDIGSYGVVRNHWYKVNVSAINNPGTPIDDPDEPIVPNDDPKEVAYIAFEIVVIPWHVINQEIEF